MIFGKDKNKGVKLEGTSPEVVEIGKNYSTEDLLIHDAEASEPTLAYLLTRMTYPDFPVPVGVFRDVTRPEYGDLMEDQISSAVEAQGKGDLKALLNAGDTWMVE